MSGPVHPESGSLHLHGANSAEIRAAVEQTVEEWGGQGPQGRFESTAEIHLPLAAGIRLGSAHLRVRVPSGGGRVEWEVLASEYRTHRSAVVVLALGALGGLASAAWPFVPQLQPLAPLGLVLLIAAWLLVAARVRYRGVAQFWDDVAAELESEVRD